MRKIISLLLALVLTASAVLAVSVSAFAEETGTEAEEEASYVRFISGDFDPYGFFSFSSKGKETSIDPDEVRYAAIRYRTITADNESGIELGAQFYVMMPKEPYVPVVYNHTQKWETVIVDMTSISVTKAGMDPVWDSDNYSDPSSIRFDPMEPNRENPAFDNDNDRGKVRDGSEIDIAWIAFFTKEEDAKAYTGKEDTPYCLIDVDCMENAVSLHNMEVEVHNNGQQGDEPVVEKVEKFVVNKKSAQTTAVSTFDKTLAIKTIEIPAGCVLQDFILTDCPTWSNKNGDSDVMAEAYVWTGDYDSTYSGKPVATAEVLNHKDNAAAKFTFENGLRYGHEYLICVTTTNSGNFGFWTADEVPEGWEVYLDDEESELVPGISYTLKTCGEIPDYEIATAAPTAEPTATPEVTAAPTAEPTAEVTAAPTDAPATDAPETKKGCGGVVSAGAVLALISVAFAVSRKKEN